MYGIIAAMQEEMKEGMADGNSMDPGPEAGY